MNLNFTEIAWFLINELTASGRFVTKPAAQGLEVLSLYRF